MPLTRLDRGEQPAYLIVVRRGPEDRCILRSHTTRRKAGADARKFAANLEDWIEITVERLGETRPLLTLAPPHSGNESEELMASNIEKSRQLHEVLKELGADCTQADAASELGWPVSMESFYRARAKLFGPGHRQCRKPAEPPIVAAAKEQQSSDDDQPSASAPTTQTETDRIGEACATLAQAVRLFRGIETTRRALNTLETCQDMMGG